MYFNVVPFHLAAPFLYPPISGAEIFVYDCRYFVARELLRFSKEFFRPSAPISWTENKYTRRHEATASAPGKYRNFQTRLTSQIGRTVKTSLPTTQFGKC